jgi:hypothetical protein
MKHFLLAVFVAAAGSSASLQEQERQVPKDSARISIQGCAKGRTFIVGPRSEHSPGNLEIEPGRRFRLNGPGKILDEIKKREGTMVEVTGLVRKGQLGGPGGVSIAGGRIRIGGALPQAGNDPTRNAAYNEVVIDVEGWRSLPESCPAR